MTFYFELGIYGLIGLAIAFAGLAVACCAVLVVLVREQRKLIRQIRKMASVYFPQYLSDSVDGQQSDTIGKVTINKAWDDDGYGRD